MRTEIKDFLVDIKHLIPVTDFPCYYITRAGEVYSEKMHKWLTPYKRDGYLRVRFRKDDKCFDQAIHRLIAKEFVNGYFDGAVVNHINGIKDDNRPCNLEWTTQKRNAQLALHKPVKLTTKSGVELYYDSINEVRKDLLGVDYCGGNLQMFNRKHQGPFKKYGLKMEYLS